MDEDPLPRLFGQAVNLHETFRALVDAGFSEDQALRLLAYLLTADDS